MCLFGIYTHKDILSIFKSHRERNLLKLFSLQKTNYLALVFHEHSSFTYSLQTFQHRTVSGMPWRMRSLRSQNKIAWYLCRLNFPNFYKIFLISFSSFFLLCIFRNRKLSCFHMCIISSIDQQNATVEIRLFHCILQFSQF